MGEGGSTVEGEVVSTCPEGFSLIKHLRSRREDDLFLYFSES